MYLIPTNLRSDGSNNPESWFFGATKDSKIKWITSGISTDCSYDGGPFCRFGSAVVTINGRVTHTLLKQTVEPGTWVVGLHGARIGVNRVNIASDVNSQELDGTSIKEILRNPGINFKAIKCFKEPATGGNTLYTVNAPNKRPAWLLDKWSCGSAGCAREFEIYYSESETKDIYCMDD